jgi:hypothetical protein
VHKTHITRIIPAIVLIFPAFAWGPEGHEIVANIALHYLTPKAKSHVTAILTSGQSNFELAGVANWADQIRPSRPETAPWHFVDIPLKRTTYDAARDCASNNCVVAQITANINSLKSGDQLDALRFLVHFLGDIHQPLHCADNNDRGGNDVHVNFLEQHTNLHKVWDSGLLGQLEDQEQLTADLINGITDAQRGEWSSGTPEAWAVESHQFAVKPAYSLVPKRQGRRVPVLDEDYETAADPVLRTQVQKAGVRLAWVINQLYDSN